MAKYRPIYTNIWKDPDFESYNPQMKLIFMYLCTNDSTTESGIYPVTIKTISNETGIQVQTVTKLLSNGLKNIKYDTDNSIVFLRNFLKYNGGGRPDLIQKSINKDFKLYPTYLWNEFKNTYPEYSDEFSSIPITIPITNSITITKEPLSNCLETVEKEIKDIFTFWNSKKIIVHRSLDQTTTTKLTAKLKSYSIKEIKQSIHNYAVVVDDPDSFFNYRWTLKDFLQRGFEKFLDKDVVFDNYLNKDKK